MKIECISKNFFCLQFNDNKGNNPFDYYAPYSYKTAQIAWELAVKHKTKEITDLQIKIDGVSCEIYIYPIADFLIGVMHYQEKVYVLRLFNRNVTIKSICCASGRALDYYNAMEDKKDGFACQSARLATVKEKNKNSHSLPRRIYLSVPKVAELLGVAYQTLSLYENQEVKPKIEKVKMLAKIYNCDTEDLFKNNELSYNSLQFLKYVGETEYKGINIEEELNNRSIEKKKTTDYFKLLCYYE